MARGLSMPKILVSTSPFGVYDKTPLELLKNSKIEYTLNPFDRKISETELIEIIPEYDAIIAGTEPITKKF